MWEERLSHSILGRGTHPSIIDDVIHFVFGREVYSNQLVCTLITAL